MEVVMSRTLAPAVWSILAVFSTFTFVAATVFAGSGDDAATQPHPLRVAEASGLKGQAVSATVGNVTLAGYLSKPEGAGPFATVIMFHEWWGLNTHIKQQADTLAKEGFAVFAPDLYDGKVATDPKTAGQYMNELDQAKAQKTLKASYAWVRAQPFAKGKKVGSVGWCMGGGHSLQLGLHEPVDAVVVYYGMVEKDPAVLKKLKGPLLGIFADRDGWITPAIVKDFEAALKTTPVKHQIHHYDADHGFANPSNPNYQSEMATDAWNNTLAFFKANLR
jgi:carboxymethylenebutenolidase